MDNFISKSKSFIPLFQPSKNKNIILSMKGMPKANSFGPCSFTNSKNNTISNVYNNSPEINIKDKIASQSLINLKNLSFKLLLNEKRKKKKINLDINTLINHKSLSKRFFSSLNNERRNENNEKVKKEKMTLTVEEKNKIKSIIKNFQDNKITTMELYRLEKNYPLNSITKSNFRFLSKESNKAFSIKRRGRKKKQINKIFLTSSNMIGKFNNKTNKILENSIKELRFSKNVNEFRKQIINSYSDYENKINEIKKKKSYYYEALNIFEECDEKKIKDAQKLEEIFYKKKSTNLFRGKPMYLYIKELNKTTENEIGNIDNTLNEYLKNNLLYNNNNLNYKNALVNKKILIQTKKNFEKFLRKKFKNKAKIFADTLYDIKDLPDKVSKKKKEPNYFHFNMNNLRRIIQVNSIKKNLYSIEEDDLLIKNTKKLKEEIRKTENSFYTLFKGSKHTLDFLKGKVKPSTKQKLSIMKNSHFGIPC